MFICTREHNDVIEIEIERSAEQEAKSDFKFPDLADAEGEDALRSRPGSEWSTWSRSCCPQTVPSTARGPPEWRTAVFGIRFDFFTKFTKKTSDSI